MTWYYAYNGQQLGPVAEQEIVQLASQGTLKADTLIWREGMGDWQPISLALPAALATISSDVPQMGGYALPTGEKDLLVQQMREGLEPAFAGTMQYAGFWWRVLAYIIDGIVLMIPSFLLVFIVVFIGALIFGAIASGGNESAAGAAIILPLFQLGAQLLSLVMTAFYHIWMVGKYGATVGKMAIGLKVVRDDGAKVTYMRAFGRWAAGQILGSIIMMTVMVLVVIVATAIFMGGMAAFSENMKSSEPPLAFLIGMVASMFVGMLLGGFPWWMCGLTSEKRALHDMICATRVIKTR